MRIGLEVECVINRRKFDFRIGEYNDPARVGNTHWKAKRDSSILGHHRFKKEKCVELVSDIIHNKTEFKNTVKELKKIFQIKKSGSLKNKVYFNKSCGCHIHVSLKNYKFVKYAHPMILIKTRKYFLKNIMRSNLSDKLKDSITMQYDRTHARISRGLTRDTQKRNAEFNFQSEEHNMGLEWRSFNLCGVSNYKELRRLLNIAYKTLRYLEKISKNWQDIEKTNITPRSEKKTYLYKKENIKLKKPQNKFNEEILLKKKKKESIPITWKSADFVENV
ncbi:MAG: amidoligase family protein [Bacteroidetes bacterium]|nr:amidoligase family protein [Bacteroidota bacterium]